MIRILHIGKFFPPDLGGMEIFLRDLTAAQRNAGCEVYALVHGTPKADDPSWLRRVPVQAQVLYAPIALGFRAALKRAIRDWAPDVLHLHMPNVSVFWALTLAGARDLPWVVHWHSDVVPTAAHGALALAYRVYQPFERAVLDHADRVVATSPPYLHASRALEPWREKCTVVPLGLDVSRLARCEPDSDNGCDAADACASRLRVFSIGRLAHYKGFETLVEVVAGMRDVELVIAGEGESRAVLEGLIARLVAVAKTNNSSVRLLGAISDADKARWFGWCEVFALASCERSEAFGIVVLEAMHFGKPCVVSDLPGSGMPWLVSSANAGLCVPLADVTAWRVALERMRDLALRAECGAAGRRALAESFDVSHCAVALDTVYRAVTEDVPVLSCAERNVRSAKARTLLIVIPARDEAQTIGIVIASLRAAGFDQVVVIDDHSRDGTGDIARAEGAMVISPVLPLGAWGGMQAGIRFGLRHGFEAVITMDADGQHEVAEIPALLAGAGRADVVIGAHPQRGSAARKLAWGWFRRLSGFGLEDLTSGFRYYNRDAMKVAASSEATLLDYQDIGVLLLLRKAGLHIVEVPVSMNLRLAGRSRIFNSWWTVARYMAATTLLCLSRWRTRVQSAR